MAAVTDQLRSIELFAGAGGLALALSKAGFHHEAIVEWNKYACQTIRENKRAGTKLVETWPDPIESDVRDVDFSAFKNIDVISGGVPCQPFSMGGKHRAHLDPRDMFPQAIRAVDEVRPRAFLFENVRGLTRPSFSNYFEYIRLRLEFPSLSPKKREDWEGHLARLEKHKTRGGKPEYRLVARVLDAADFGVPQRRHRVFIVGVREDLDREFCFAKESHSMESLLHEQFVSGDYWERHRVPRKLRPRPPIQLESKLAAIRDKCRPKETAWATVRDAISDLPDPQHAKARMIQAHQYQPGARAYPGHTGSPLDEPSKALKSGVHGVPGGENMLRCPDGSVRYLTVRESARIQGFSDGFCFAGAWSEAMRQLGNAVPVDLAYAVAKQLAKTIS